MNTTKGILHGTNKEAARNLLDVRIILAVLWAAGMLSSLNGDTFRLSAMTNFLGVSSEQLSVFAVVLAGQVFMSGLTLILNPPVSRWANRIIGIFYAMFILAFEVLNIFVLRSAGYEIVWVTAQLVFALLVVWYAWKWTNHESQPE
jgi:predicted ABC-type sugar transport system permease subunit